MRYIDTVNSYVDVQGSAIAYREVGTGSPGIPLVMLTHPAATLDEWDPLLVDLLAREYHVVVLDLPGVGASEGAVGRSIPAMATQTIEILRALGHHRVHLLGISMGGMIAQEMVRQEPGLVERLVLVGTAPRGGEGVAHVTRRTFAHMVRGVLTRNNPKRYIFYPHSRQGADHAARVLQRMAQREKEKRDTPMSLRGFLTQLCAIRCWGRAPQDTLSHLTMPTLIVNGDDDREIPTCNSIVMHERIADSRLVIYPDAGHGSLFQEAEALSDELLRFLKPQR